MKDDDLRRTGQWPGGKHAWARCCRRGFEPPSRTWPPMKAAPRGVCLKKKDDDLTQQYLNNSPLQSQVCLLGAPRCHGVGLIVGALGVSGDQLRDALLDGILSPVSAANQSGSVVLSIMLILSWRKVL
jgi:hypothetical protein